MKVLSTPQFTNRVAESNDAVRETLRQLLNRLDSINYEELLSAPSLQLTPLGNDVFVIADSNLRIFCTFAEDDEGRYLVLLDLSERNTALEAAKLNVVVPRMSINPRRNPAINPRLNPAINPRLNPDVNPGLNPNINPRLNPKINPRLNPNINPRLNPNINPQLNPNINPKLNPSINPRLNPNINPRLSNFDGPYVYTLDLEPVGFVLIADDDVMLRFDFQNEAVGLYVAGDEDTYATFNMENEWIGFLVLAEDEPKLFLSFDSNNEWDGVIV